MIIWYCCYYYCVIIINLSSIAVSWRRWRKSPSVCLSMSLTMIKRGFHKTIWWTPSTMTMINMMDTIHDYHDRPRWWSQWTWWSHWYRSQLTCACRRNRSHWFRFSNQNRRRMPWCSSFHIQMTLNLIDGIVETFALFCDNLRWGKFLTNADNNPNLSSWRGTSSLEAQLVTDDPRMRRRTWCRWSF